MDLTDGVRDRTRVDWIREHADEVLKGMGDELSCQTEFDHDHEKRCIEMLLTRHGLNQHVHEVIQVSRY